MTLLEMIKLSTSRVPCVQPMPAPDTRIENLSGQILRGLDADGLSLDEAESALLACLYVTAHTRAKTESAERAKAEAKQAAAVGTKTEQGGFFDALFS